MVANAEGATLWVAINARLAKQGAKEFNSAVESMKRTGVAGMGALKAAILGVEIAIIAGGVMAMKKMMTSTMDLLKASVNTADSFEMLRLQINTLSGSVEAGERVFDALWTTAKKIPFTIEQIARGAKTMKAWGALGKNVEGTMIGLADAASATGSSMETLSTVIGRAWQAGRFRLRGPGAILRGMMQTRGLIKDMTKATLPEFRTALKQLLTDPQYGIAGMSEKLATTWTGIKSMIGDSVAMMQLAVAGGEGGFFDQIKGLGRDVMDWLRTDEIMKAMKAIGDIAGKVVSDFRAKFISMIEQGHIRTLIKDWIGNFRVWSNMARNIIANLPAICQAVMNMVTTMGLGLQKLFQTVGSAMQVLSNFGIGEDRARKAQESLLENTRMQRRIMEEMNYLQKAKFRPDEVTNYGLRQVGRIGPKGSTFDEEILLRREKLKLLADESGELRTQFNKYKRLQELLSGNFDLAVSWKDVAAEMALITGEQALSYEEVAKAQGDILGFMKDQQKETKKLSSQTQGYVDIWVDGMTEAAMQLRGISDVLGDIAQQMSRMLLRSSIQALSNAVVSSIIGGGTPVVDKTPTGITSNPTVQDIELSRDMSVGMPIQQKAGAPIVVQITTMDTKSMYENLTRDKKLMPAVISKTLRTFG